MAMKMRQNKGRLLGVSRALSLGAVGRMSGLRRSKDRQRLSVADSWRDAKKKGISASSRNACARPPGMPRLGKAGGLPSQLNLKSPSASVAVLRVNPRVI